MTSDQTILQQNIHEIRATATTMAHGGGHKVSHFVTERVYPLIHGHESFIRFQTVVIYLVAIARNPR